MLTQSELLSRQADRESNARTYPRGMPLAAASAHGVEIVAVDGKRYLDFFAGAGVLALGHNHPKVVEAVKAQLDVFVHGLDLPTRDRARARSCAARGAQPPTPRRRPRHRSQSRTRRRALCGPSGCQLQEGRSVRVKAPP